MEREACYTQTISDWHEVYVFWWREGACDDIIEDLDDLLRFLAHRVCRCVDLFQHVRDGRRVQRDEALPFCGSIPRLKCRIPL